MTEIGRFDDEPDFVNEQGVKWWMVSGNIWMTELPTGEKEYVGILNGDIVASGTALDAVALKLELLDFAERPPDVPQQGAPEWMKASE